MVQDLKALGKFILSKKLFLWDFDGCFWNTEPLQYKAYKMAFEQYSHTLTEEVYYSIFTHQGLGAGAEIQRASLTCTVSEIRALKANYYQKLLLSEGAAEFTEIRSILPILTSNLQRVAIASNSPSAEIESILNDWPLRKLVSNIFTPNEFILRKPAPDVFLHAIKSYNVSLSDTLIFEDSERGLQAAAGAGCDAIWIKTPINAGLQTSLPYHASVTHAELLQALLTAATPSQHFKNQD